MISRLVNDLLLRTSRGVVDPRRVVNSGIVDNVLPEQIQGNSLDLTVAEVNRIDGGVILGKNIRKLPEYVLQEPYYGVEEGQEGHWYKLEPQHLYQIEFAEKVRLPEYLCGITLVRSTMAKSGCSGESGLFDSGYHGSTGMMVSVKYTSYIEKGARVAQMVFFRSNAYKAKYNGYYQSSNGPKDWLANYKEVSTLSTGEKRVPNG